MGSFENIPSRAASTRRLAPGDSVLPRELTTIGADRIRLPAAEGLTHLQFRRFAGCPVCNVHLRSVARRHDELVAAGIGEVAVFHSPAETMLPHHAELPFAAVADPCRALYAEFGVESSPKANLHPRVWTTPLKWQSWSVVVSGLRAGGKPGPRGDGMLGLPADFLIDPAGKVLAAHYGRHAGDHWPVDEVLRLADASRKRGNGA